MVEEWGAFPTYYSAGQVLKIGGKKPGFSPRKYRDLEGLPKETRFLSEVGCVPDLSEEWGAFPKFELIHQ